MIDVIDIAISKKIAEQTVADLIGSGSGSQGLSAYDIAVKNGFQGTERQWLASLKGEQGESGAAGIDWINLSSDN